MMASSESLYISKLQYICTMCVNKKHTCSCIRTKLSGYQINKAKSHFILTVNTEL